MNILETIVERKRVEVARLPDGPVAADQLRTALRQRGDGVRDFFGALARPRRGDIGLIAEVKKASPSRGVICPDFDPVRIARAYEEAGASGLSVLTDEAFFQGSLEYLKAIRQAVSLPLLRKDFIIDERQILEAIEWGADAILLIVAILSDDQLRHYHTLANAAGLSALVEVHDETELERALSCGARLLGINNRNLKTFTVDLAVTERLAGQGAAWAHGRGNSVIDGMPDLLMVSESGIHTRADVLRLKACGARAILVGESLMASGRIADKAAELLGRIPA